MTTLSRQASDSDDVLPTTPPSEPRLRTAPIHRRASVVNQVTQITSDPVLAGKLMGDLVSLNAIADAIGALNSARAAVVSGDQEGMRVELRMAIRCAQEALETETED